MFLEIHVEGIVDNAVDYAHHFAVAELGLGLTFELGLGQLHADDGRKTFAHVVAGKAVALELLLKVGLALHVVVDGAGERGLEAGKMRAAFMRADVVRKRQRLFIEAGVVLQGEVHRHVVLNAFAADDGMQAGLVAVQILDELLEAAFGMIGVTFVGALVVADDGEALVEIGQFLEALLQNVEGVDGSFEYFLIGLEAYGGTVPFRIAEGLHLGDGHAAFITLTPALAVAAHGDFQPAGKSVHAGDAHAVQTARNLVGVVVELAASVQFGHDHLHGGNAQLGMNIHGNTAAVVAHGNAVVHVQDDFYPVAVAGHGLVYGVVHHFVHEMMETTDVRAAYIHGRALADRGQTFQNRNGGRVVRILAGPEIFLGHGIS